MEDALGFHRVEAWIGRDLVCVLDEENKVLTAEPDQGKLLL